MSPTNTANHNELRYSFKPSLLGAVWEFELTPTALLWRGGRRQAHWPYDKIMRVNLSYRPISLQANRFRADILGGDGRKSSIVSASWRSMVVVKAQSDDYRRFMLELHRRMAAADSRAVFSGGLNPVIYWLGAGLLALVALAMLALIVIALREGQRSGALFVAAFLIFSAWQLGSFLKRNRPRTYHPDAVPDDLLPAPEASAAKS